MASNEGGDQMKKSKVEPEDWEDAAEIPTPKLEASESGNQVLGSSEDAIGGGTKKYSRDFLVIFAEQCTALPEGFEFAPDIAEALMASNVNFSHESYSNTGTGRNIDNRPNATSRLDRRGSGIIGDEDKNLMSTWMNCKGKGGYGGVGVGGYGGRRSGGRGGGGDSGSGSYGGGFGKGKGFCERRFDLLSADGEGNICSSPQTPPLQMMHKTDSKYEVGKVSDEEQAKQRQLKAILNKLTPQNFEKLFEQVKQVNIDNRITLNGVISQIFDKALMEPTFCQMYANFCYCLSQELPDLRVDNEKITFKKLLLNKCQEEFKRGVREQEEADKADDKGTVKQTEAEREEKRLKAVGYIRLMGELDKKKMVPEIILHVCIKKLLGQYGNPDEEDVESLCILMSMIGEKIDGDMIARPKAKERMDAYFDAMSKLSNNMKLSSRVRFMLKDAIDLRRNKWQQRRKIEKLHSRDAARERHAQSSRLARTPSMGSSSAQRGQPMDFSPRGGGSMLPSPGSQLGTFRAVPSQARGHMQDARFDDRHVLENRMLVPLPQRPVGDDTITLGPQGRLARGGLAR